MSSHISVRVQQGHLKNMKISLNTNKEVTSQQVKEATFQICKNFIDNPTDTIFIDCFAGSGQMGVEAISRGYKNVSFYESSPLKILELSKWLDSKNIILKESYRITKQNMFYTFNSIDNIKKWLDLDLSLIKEKESKNIEVILYLDPPYKTFWGNIIQVNNLLTNINLSLNLSLKEKFNSLIWVCQAPSPNHRIWKDMSLELKDNILLTFPYSRRYGKNQILVHKTVFK